MFETFKLGPEHGVMVVDMRVDRIAAGSKSRTYCDAFGRLALESVGQCLLSFITSTGGCLAPHIITTWESVYS